jgi:uncharacterized protein YcfL
MRKLIIFLISTITLAGCASSPEVEKLQDFTPQSKTFVLLSSTQWDTKLRSALAKKGLKVLRFSSQHQVVAEGKDGEIARIHNEAEARYGLTFTWSPINRCLFNSTMLINGTIEVTDIKTNEVLMVIDKEGETGPCSPRSKVFDELADSLAKNWK